MVVRTIAMVRTAPLTGPRHSIADMDFRRFRAFSTLAFIGWAAVLATSCTKPPLFEPPPEPRTTPGQRLERNGAEILIRGKGESCGGSPAAGAPLEECAQGLVCDHDDTAVDAPGHCR